MIRNSTLMPLFVFTLVTTDNLNSVVVEIMDEMIEFVIMFDKLPVD